MKYSISVSEKLKKKYEEIDGNQARFCVFGARKIGEIVSNLLEKYRLFDCFIDNDLKKQQRGHLNQKVISLKQFLQLENKPYIIIAASQANCVEIAKELEKEGLCKGESYWLHDEFIRDVLPIILYFKYKHIFLPLVQISLTERCSLKCKKCAHACYAVDSNHKDLTLKQVYKSLDCFFEHVDYIHEFVLIGGEPLLYKQLDKVIQYIGESYRDQIDIFSITTNGTILPSAEIQKWCQKYDVLFRISNYSQAIPRLEHQYEKLAMMLKNDGIQYILMEKEHLWMDYGFEYVNRHASEEELIQVFDACHTPCHEIRENRFYYCVMARSVSENLNMNVGNNDYLDLDELSGEEGEKKLLAYFLGYSDKGYLDMCNYCHGAECVNHTIPVAEQIGN